MPEAEAEVLGVENRLRSTELAASVRLGLISTARRGDEVADNDALCPLLDKEHTLLSRHYRGMMHSYPWQIPIDLGGHGPT